MIVFGECGNFYGSKLWHSTSKYRRTVWQCNHKYSNKKRCCTPHFYEEDIKEAFLKVFNGLIKNKEEIIQGYEVIIEELMDTTKIDKNAASVFNEIQIVEELMRKMVEENSKAPLDQYEYNQRYDELVERYQMAQNEYHSVEEKRQNRKVRKDIIIGFI
ncbi:MAG: zinc ribbon domain-containing protein [Erysipelotrichaceae bacterium]|nr:zinc ribbon domain-containing protein [Erysipelotrichaceae bacterium]